MLGVLLADGAELGPLKQRIIEQTEGNPFFMEEIVQSLFEEGVLVRNGTVRLTRPLDALTLPPTVQGILAARIDRLPPEQKELLQTLAVLGKEFTLSLVRAVSERGDDEPTHCWGSCSWPSSSTSSRPGATWPTPSSTRSPRRWPTTRC
jgi:predicted ATPase